MSFLIKGILKTLLKQYLNIVDDISMEKGFIQLPSGHLNHQNINGNQNLINAGIQITSSEYIGLAISIPLMEILGKPVVFRVDKLKVMVEVDDEKRKNKKQGAKQKQQGHESDNKQQKKITVSQRESTKPEIQGKQNNDGYIKGLVNRLLANMEIQLKSLQILVIHKHNNGSIHSYRVSIDSLILKNSLSLLQANLLKKIVNLGRIQVERLQSSQFIEQEFFNNKELKGSQYLMVSLEDLNMSLNIDYKKINAIVLVDTIKFKIHKQMSLQLMDMALESQGDSIKRLNKRANKQQKRYQSEKAENIQINTPKVSKISLDSIEIKINNIDLILTVPDQNSIPHQFYSLTGSNIEISKQNSGMIGNIGRSIEVCLQAQKFRIMKRDEEIVSILVNQLNQQNIAEKLNKTKSNQKSGSSKKLISDYDRVIKNKKRQFQFKMILPKLSYNPTIQVDTLGLSLNLTPSIIGDFTLLLSTLAPKIEQMLANNHQISQINQKFAPITPQRIHNALLDEQQEIFNIYDLLIVLRNISVEIGIGKCLSLCVLIPEFVEIKKFQKQINMNVEERIWIFADRLQLLKVKQIQVINSPKQAIVNIAEIEVQLNLAYLSRIKAQIQTFIRDNYDHIQYLTNFINQLQIRQPQKLGQNQTSELLSPNLYFRNYKLLVSIGDLTQTNIYFPVFMAQLSQIKAYFSASTKSFQFIIKCISCMSPQTLTWTSLLSQNNSIRIISQCRQSNSIKVQVKDPLALQIQQQHLNLLLNMLYCLPDSQKLNKEPESMFIKIKNQTNTDIIVKQQFQRSGADNTKPGYSPRQKENKLVFESETLCRSQIPKEYPLSKNDEQEVFLTNPVIKIKINEEISDPIFLNKCADIIYELPVIFSYQEECSYIVEVNIGKGKLEVTIKYRYQLHIFEGLNQQSNHIKQMVIKSKPENELRYLRNQENQSEIAQEMEQEIKKQNQKYNNKLSFDWELLGEQMLDNLEFLINSEHSTHPRLLKVSKLISNNIHYKLYGLYDPKQQKEETQLYPKYNYFYYYIFQDLSESETVTTHRYHFMPFLAFNNHLTESNVALKIINKKQQIHENLVIKQGQSVAAFGGTFDYYMKQYMIVIRIQQQMALNEELAFESQEHYINTFFMVQQSFESPIELRSQDNRKRYIRVKESFIKKTKVLQFSDPLFFNNFTDIPLSISFSTKPQVSPKCESPNKLQELPIHLDKQSQTQIARKLKKDDILLIEYRSKTSQSIIELPISRLWECRNKMALSFNFCGLDEAQSDKPQTYLQILMRVEYSQNNTTQSLYFTPLITLTNTCKDSKLISINKRVVQSHNGNNEHSISLFLPSNTNKDYNNKCLNLNMQKIYDELFLKGENWIIEGNSDMMVVQIQNRKDKQTKSRIKFLELINRKIVELDKSVYSMIKSLKNDKIEFYLSDRLFNTNIQNARYFLFNNQTNQNFLMSSSDQEYAKYFLFPETQQLPTHEPEKSDALNCQQKIFISTATKNQSYQPNILLNKDKYDIFLCDQHQQKLEPFNSKKLQKMNIKQERFTVENFTILNLEEQNHKKTSCVVQILVNNFSCRLLSKDKAIGGLLEIKTLNYRNLQLGKSDFLLKDITFSILHGSKGDNSPKKPSLHSQHLQILRIPEESYFLLEHKLFDHKILLIKNLFLKCKIIDLHVNKHLLSFLIYLQRYTRQTLRFHEQFHRSQRPDSSKIGNFEYASNHKIVKLGKQKLLMIRSMNLYQVNLCLNVQTNSNTNFSNIISLPELSISNHNYKANNLLKDLSNHYLTNIIAKFPKLSFIYQNLKSPIGMIKSLIEARDVITEKNQEEEKRRYNWNRSYIVLDTKYDCEYLLVSRKQNKVKGRVAQNKSYCLNLHNKIIAEFLWKQFWDAARDNCERVICKLQTVVYCNISKNLPNASEEGSQLAYLLTNKNIFIFWKIPTYSPSARIPEQDHIVEEKVQLKEIQSIEILKYNEKNGQLIINFKRKGCLMKILDQVVNCENICALIRNIIV